jgi:hypothetical protein
MAKNWLKDMSKRKNENPRRSGRKSGSGRASSDSDVKKEMPFFVKVAIGFVVLFLALMVYAFFQPNPFANAAGNNANLSDQFKNCTKVFFASGPRDSFSIKMVFENTTTTTASQITGTETINGTVYNVRETISKASEMQDGKLVTLDSSTKTYLANDWHCVRQTTVVTSEGNVIPLESECGDGLANYSLFKVCGDSWNLLRKETITTAAGTFNTNVYSAPENMTLWIADGVQAPIRIEVAAGTGASGILITLESYSKG